VFEFFGEKGWSSVSQRGVQLVIGKLLTDPDLRQRFEAQGGECLVGLREGEVDLNEIEMAAVVATDPRVWSTMAKGIDRGLQRVRRVASEGTNRRLRIHLTERQQRVLAGVSEGLSNKEIAVEEGVSVGAVKATVQQLFDKAGVRRRTQLIRLAIEGALISSRHS
jgi:DNA-binding CsgD family transcriptional regulator